VPPAPQGVTATAGDSHITLHWSTVGSPVPTTINSSTVVTNTVRAYQLFVIEHGGTFPGSPATVVNSQGATSGDVQGLTNGVAYDLAVQALSGGGNPGAMSTTVNGTPALVYDFWRTYKFDGGQETGGCATGEVGLMALLGLVPLAFRRKRRSA
jgi:MYXO-CTERM domain-containing protein